MNPYHHYRIPEQVTSASQDVSIMAANTAHFNDIVIAADEIYEMFAVEFPEGTLIRNDGQTIDGELTLQFGTRYFTQPKVAKGESSLPLDRSIDPFGLLAKAVAYRGKHLGDNKVKYYMRSVAKDGERPKYVRGSRL